MEMATMTHHAKPHDEKISLIPQPFSVEPASGVFRLGARTDITHAASKELCFAANELAEALRPLTGLPLPVNENCDAVGGSIHLASGSIDSNFGAQGYALDITQDGILLQAQTGQGVFHGIQTIRQLIPEAAAIGAHIPKDGWPIPCVRIIDQPRYEWRGLMLDSGRCFMPVPVIKRYLDIAAYLKLNLFHWHLIEDQGWRAEIKAYPKLTEVGAFWHPEQHRHGFYTQNDMAEVVAYAAERHITVMPEVEIPGHTLAAMFAYPDLCCTGQPVENAGHQKDLYCAGNEGVYEFIETVIAELCAIFPGPFFHIGGDEAPKDRWKECPKCQASIKAEGLKDEDELQGYMTGRVAAMLAARGKRIMGWEEILDGKDQLPPDAIVQWWRRRPPHSNAYALAAARAGFDVFSSPNNWAYTIWPVNPTGRFHMNRTTDLTEAYEADFTPKELSASEQAHFLGGEICMWMDDRELHHIDNRLFPRALALAEALWSPLAVRDFEGFHARVKDHYSRLDALGIGYGPAFRVSENKAEAKELRKP
jgi:hexosaminidase